MNIVEVQYARIIQYGDSVDYMENMVWFDDGSSAFRNGITRVHGETIKKMAENLKKAIRQNAWWSLQTTSLNELKAAYQAGFRNRDLSSLEEHIKAFQSSGETLQVEFNR